MEVEWSDIAAQDPDVIIIAVEIVGLEAVALELSVLAEEAGWWSLRATRHREVYAVDGTHLCLRDHVLHSDKCGCFLTVWVISYAY
jgi:ABC-type Fe3+-citrate transport system substrate-binding protein